MNEHLRPATLGEILDRTVNLFRARFLVYAGIGMVPAGVLLVFACGLFLLSAWSSNAEPAAVAAVAVAIVGLMLLGTPVLIAAAGLGAAAITHAASQAFMGEAISIRAAYGAAWKRGWRYIWLFVLESLLIGVAPFLVWIIVVIALGLAALVTRQNGGAAGVVPSILLLLVMLLLGVYAAWMLLRLCLAFPAAVVENTGAWAAVKRAYRLCEGTRGRILVLFLLGWVLGTMLSMLITLPVLLAASLWPGMNTPQHEQTMGMVFLFTLYASSFAVQALTKPLYGIALTLFYYDQRVRKEGFDIEWLMRRAGMVEAKPEATAPAPWMPAGPKKQVQDGTQNPDAGATIVAQRQPNKDEAAGHAREEYPTGDTT